MGDKSAQRQFFITVSGVSEPFSTKTGGNPTSDVSRDYDGGSVEADIATAPPVYSDLTVGRGYGRYRDAGMLRVLRPRVGRSWHVITVTPLDRDEVPLTSNKTTYYGVLVGTTDPDADSNSATTARCELTFAIKSAK